MNKFKEQVWVDSHMDCVPCFYEPLDEKSVSYTRTDVAQAQVAAAYLDAGNLHQSLWCETSAYRTDQIIKRTPTDAKAALDRIVQEAVKEALEQAASSQSAAVDTSVWAGRWWWWAGRDGEWCTVGPEASRDDVIAAAVADGTGEFQGEDGNWWHRFHIMEARQDPLRLSDWIGLDWLLERADESLADSDRVSCENDDGPWFEATKEQEKDLCDRIRNVCDAWQIEHGLTFHSTTFSHTRNREYVNTEIAALKGGEA